MSVTNLLKGWMGLAEGSTGTEGRNLAVDIKVFGNWRLRRDLLHKARHP